MQEFFDHIPEHGMVRPTKRYQERLGKAVERSSRMQPLTYTGASGSGASGPYQLIDQTPFIFAEITAQPTGSYTGYSWIQRRQDKEDAGDIEWVEPPTALRGDNGSVTAPPVADVSAASLTDDTATLTTGAAHSFSPGMTVTIAGLTDPFLNLNGTYTIEDVPTSTTFTYHLANIPIDPASNIGTATVAAYQRSSVAYAANNDKSIAVGTIVVLAPGYLHTSATNAADLALVDPMNPLGGSAVDSEAALARDWIIIGAIDAGPVIERCRITGKPTCILGKRYYPAVLDLMYGTGSDTFYDGEEVWVRQRIDAPLGTTGTFICVAKKERKNFWVAVDAETVVPGPLFVTNDRLFMVGVRCDPDTGEIIPIYNGEYTGCEGEITPGLNFSVAANSQYMPLIFNPGIGGVVG